MDSPPWRSFIVYSLSIFLTAFPFCAQAMKWHLDCIPYLEKHSDQNEAQQAIIFDLLNLSQLPDKISPAPQDSKTIQTFPHSDVPELLQIEDLKKNGMIPHELQTARDYAIFLKRKYNQHFVLISDFRGQAVPVFDGLVFDPNTEQIVANVSLKFASIKMPFIKLELLKESMEGRLNYEYESGLLRTPARWFMAVNSRGSLGGIRRAKNFSAMLEKTRILINLFGLFTTGRGGFGSRPMRTVIDVRNHGYPFAYFKEPDVQQTLLEIMQKNPRHHLTLLWNDHEVFEIDASGIKLQ